MKPNDFKLKGIVTVFVMPDRLTGLLRGRVPYILPYILPNILPNASRVVVAGLLPALLSGALLIGPVLAQGMPVEPGQDILPEPKPEMDLGPAPEAGDEEIVLSPDADESTLLDRLAEADAAEAIRVERELQALWRKSGSASMDLLFKRGRDAMENQDLQAAIEHFTALTDHAPGFAEGWHARATAYFQADLYGPAVADLERALALNPNNYRAIFGLGTILETFGDENRAFEAYLRAKAIHPHFEAVTEALDRLRPGVEGQTL